MQEEYRMAVVIPNYGTIGGAEQFTSELTDRIAGDPRYEVHVFANKWAGKSGRPVFHKVPIVFFPKFLTTISFAWLARKKIGTMSFDLIHAHDRVFDADIFTVHGIPHRIWVREVRKKGMSLFDLGTAWVERYLVRSGRCRKFLAVSRLTAEKFIQEYPYLNTDKLEVVHPGINAEEFVGADKQAARRTVRGKYGIGPEDTVILFVSMNFDIKGLDALLAGLARFKSMHPHERWKLLIVGKGEVRHYSRIASSMGIGDHIVFSGVVPKEKLSEIYAACDIFAMPSKFDTFGMTVLEAMAASLPVMISGNVGAKDLVREGENGFVIRDTDNAGEIAARTALLMGREIRNRLAQEALKTAKDHSWNSVAKKMETIYESVLYMKRSDSGS